VPLSYRANEGIAQAPGTAPKAGTRLITLGTAGGPVPRAKRAQSSNLLIVNGTPYLIDAGDGTARRLAKLKFNLRSLGTIFITHGHNDHTGGLPHLLSVQWGAQRSQPINVYGPPGTQGMIKAAIAYLNYDAEIRISDGSRTTPIEKVFFGHDVGTGQVYQDANITVTAVENTHFHFPAGSPAYGKYKSYSYRFKTPDRVIVFTGDTGESNALTELAKDADPGRTLAGHEPEGAGRIHPAHDRGAHHARADRQDGRARQRQDRDSVAPDGAPRQRRLHRLG
jgi:ribonuclease BN (tRNA processing enzyme)